MQQTVPGDSPGGQRRPVRAVVLPESEGRASTLARDGTHRAGDGTHQSLEKRAECEPGKLLHARDSRTEETEMPNSQGCVTGLCRGVGGKKTNKRGCSSGVTCTCCSSRDLESSSHCLCLHTTAAHTPFFLSSDLVPSCAFPAGSPVSVRLQEFCSLHFLGLKLETKVAMPHFFHWD